MDEFIFEHYAAVCLDRILPAAEYFGFIGDEETYGKLQWIDKRPKPEWSELQAEWPAVLAILKWDKYKESRTEELTKLVITVGGQSFDADEDSQNRMARAIIIMQTHADVESVRWRLADNSEANVDLTTMSNALLSAATAQTELWFSAPPIPE